MAGQLVPARVPLHTTHSTRTLGGLALFLLLAVQTTAQSTRPEQALAARPGEVAANLAVVGGQIRNASTGVGIADANIMLVAAQADLASRSTRSDADGRFIFEDVPPGRFRVLVERYGFARQAAGGRPMGQSGTVYVLAAGEKLTVDIALAPNAVIAGRTLTPSGEPIPNLPVQLLQHRYFVGSRRLMPAGSAPSAITNDLGEFRIANVAAAQYFLLAGAHPLAAPAMVTHDTPSARGKRRRGYVQSYYPTGVSSDNALPISVGAGREVGNIEITMQEEPVFRVSGQLRHAQASLSMRGSVLTLTRQDGDHYSLLPASMTVVQSVDGRFDIANVAAGRYVLTAQRPSAPAEIAIASVDVMDDDVDDIDLTLGAGVEIPVTATYVSRTGQRIQESRPLDARVELRPAANTLFVFGMTPTGPGGTIKDVLPGPYVLRVQNLPAEHYLKAATYGSEDVLNHHVEVVPKSSPLAIVFQQGGGSVDVTVHNAKQRPQSGALVGLIPVNESSRINLSRVTTTDQFGMATIDAVAPGRYFVLAFEDVDPRALESPAFFELFKSKAKRLVVTDGAGSTVVVSLIPAEDVLKADAGR